MFVTFIAGTIAVLSAQSVFVDAYQGGNGWKTSTKKSSPQPTQPACKAVQRDANFDDLTGVPGLEFNPIPTPYMGLYYQGFDFTTIVQTNVAPGIIPHSGANYAASNVVTQLQGTPMLTTNYQNSTIQSFSLQSFYLGCVVNLANGAAAVPTQCNMEISGYKGSDNSISNAQQVCARQFQYNPTSAVAAQQMAFSGSVPGCDNIQFAIVTFSLPGGSSALNADLALVLDDIKYTTCSK